MTTTTTTHEGAACRYCGCVAAECGRHFRETVWYDENHVAHGGVWCCWKCQHSGARHAHQAYARDGQEVVG